MVTRTAGRPWRALGLCLGLLGIVGVGPTWGGTFGVPTNLNADGTLSATSVNPPGWFVLTGPTAANSVGDTVHQVRLFIEVEDRGAAGGTETLDIRVFDPGASGARDGAGTTASSTTYTLYRPNSGAALATATIADDVAATTENRLARFSSTGAFTLLSGGSMFTGAALSAGLYELRITMTAGNEVNAFGVDIRDGVGVAYKVYTVGSTNTPDTAFVAGSVTEGAATPAAVTQPMAFYPYVSRGCSVATSNYDMDADNASGTGAGAAVSDTFAVTTALAASGDQLHVENSVLVEPTNTINLESNNYGMFTLTNDTGTQNNRGIEWRVTDFMGWNTNPLARPRDPASPVRMYMPNGATPIGGNPYGTAPLEPRLAVAARVVDGTTNPPVVGSTTRYVITASVDNLSGSAISNVAITVPLVTGETYVANSSIAIVDGVETTPPALACTETAGAGYQSCTFATIAAGSVASYQIMVDDLPTATGLRRITGATTTRAARMSGLTTGGGATATATFAAAHGFQTGDYVTISGAEQSGYNGLFQITVTNATQFTYTPVGAPAWPATGATILATVPGCPAAADGPVCATYTPAFSSATYSRTETLGPVCPLTVYVTPTNINLGVAKTAAPNPVTAGQNLTFTITVTNPAGSSTANNVILADMLPANTTFRSLSAPVAWTCTSPPVGTTGTLSCSIASLAANTTSTFTLVVRVDPAATGTISNTATVSALGTDVDPSNNSSTATVNVSVPPASADLAITKTAGPVPVVAGADVTYTITATNNGPSAAAAPTLTDRTPRFPPATFPTTFRALTIPAGWTCPILPAVGASGNIACNASGPMPAGQTVTFVLVVRTDAASPMGTEIENAGQAGTGAAISSTTADPDTVNNAATASSTVGLAAPAPICATPGADGTGSAGGSGVPIQGVVNTYYPGIATAAAGAASILLGAATGSTQPIAPGDLLLVIQMQDATINSLNTGSYGDGSAGDPARGSTALNNAGLYEYVTATNSVAVAGGTLTIASGPLNRYTATVTVSSLTQVGGTATAITTVAHGLVTGDRVTIAGANEAGYNATFIVTVPAANRFTFTVPTANAATATGAITATKSEASTMTIPISGVAHGAPNTTATVTTTGNHNLEIGDVVTVSGITPAAYDGTWLVSEIPSANTFRYAMGVHPPNGTSAGTALRHASQGQRRFQVVRVPQYTNVTLGSTLTAASWDGTAGGILVIDVAGELNLGGATVDVSGEGYRGGGGRRLTGGGGANTDYRTSSSEDYNGSKGEGIAGTPRYVWDQMTDALVDSGIEGYDHGSHARGAPGNAGGGSTDGNPAANNQNSGGGGGGNGGAGGQGGNTWNSNLPRGGFGGAAFAASGARITPGGGGGAGTRNDSSGVHSSGGTGGGIILMRAGSVSGTGTLSADGWPGLLAENDGAGGGGAGGTIVLTTMSGSLSGLTASARGGQGGDAWPGEAPGTYPGERHGPGGGGGGGVILLSSAAGQTDVSGGANGITTTALDAYNAMEGDPGTVGVATAIPGVNSGAQCSADLSVVKTPVPSSPTANQATYDIVVTNNGFRTATNVTVVDALPIPPVSYVSADPSQGAPCAFVSPTVTCNLGSIASGASAVVTIVVNSPGGLAPANTADVSSDQVDPVTTNDAGTSGADADLAVTLAGTPEPVSAGGLLTYVATVTNNGPNLSTGATFSFVLPPLTTFNTMLEPAGWTCTAPALGAGGNVVCERGAAMPVLASETFRMAVLVDSDAPPNAALPATAQVASAGDANTSNNAATILNHVTASIALVTRAAIRGIRVDPAAGLIEFATGWQRGTLGFNLYATPGPEAPPTGQLPLNEPLVRAPRVTTMTPTLYRCELAPFSGTHIWIEELESGGGQNLMGPFLIGDAHLAAILTRLERDADGSDTPIVALEGGASARMLAPAVTGSTPTLRATAFMAMSAMSAPTLLAAATAPISPVGLRVEIDQPGKVSLTRADLLAAGLPTNVWLSSVRVSLQGVTVASRVVNPYLASETLVFQAAASAPASPTVYSRSSVYVLTWRSLQPQMRAPLTREGDGTWAGYQRVERATLYVASVPRGTDPWLWDVLVSDGSTWPDYDPPIGRFTLPQLEATTGAVPVVARFIGMSPHRHQVGVSINGVPVGTVAFQGVKPALLSGTIPRSVLRDGSDPAALNELSISYSSDAPSDDPGIVYLDHLDLKIRAARSTAPAVVRQIAGWDPRLPIFRGTDTDYLIITHAQFADQARRLASLKSAEGHRVMLVDVQRAYDYFTGGYVEAEAVAALIRTVRKQTPLRYVLLFGDDTFDYHDEVGTGAVAYVPSLYGWDGEYGRVPSETRYADVNGDGSPDVAIGRLPAKNVAEAALLVDKVERQAAWRLRSGQHLFVVDRDDPTPGTPSFVLESMRMAKSLDHAAAVTWADAAQGTSTARNMLFGAMRQGVGFTHVFGHGAPWQWGNAGLLTVDDVEGTAPALPDGPEFVALTWACDAQMFTYLWGNSLNEALLLRPAGGALASFGPAGLVDVAAQATLYQRLYAELRSAPTLGVAIQRAKARALAEDGRGWRPVAGWNLLGDPALALH